MFKKLFVSAIVSAFMITSAHAFYDKALPSSWRVFGDAGNQERNPGCVMSLVYNDGSEFQLIRDLKDGELYIWFKNNEWNISDEIDKVYPMRINFYNSRGDVVGDVFEYVLVNKSTIVIRNLNIETFIPVFMEMGSMRFVMEGTIQNAEIPLTGTREGIEYLAQCIKGYYNNPPKGDTPVIPDGIKQNI